MFKYLLSVFVFAPLITLAQIVEWHEETAFDFGVLSQGQPEEVDFHFTNISSDTLYIDNVRSTCGCTAPYWELRPILPDSSSHIRIKYDAYKEGHFYKKIKVFFNKQQKAERLSIAGEVIPNS